LGAFALGSYLEMIPSTVIRSGIYLCVRADMSKNITFNKYTFILPIDNVGLVVSDVIRQKP
jgi:hypothetical protein